LNQIPEDILNDTALNAAIAELPSTYNLEVHKCVWHLRKFAAKKVALQLPEGLLLFAQILADIFQRFCGVETLIMGDVTYGACCVDDFTADTLGCDFLIHYGHSCLIPINQTSSSVRMLYVFVEIAIDAEHIVQLLRAHYKPEQSLAVMGTVQFIAALQYVKQALGGAYTRLYVPQAKPLSPGEVLGCTSPKLPEGTDALLFVADGRFHLEAAMIHNPTVPAFRYDPYSKKLTRECYDHLAMRRLRRDAIEKGMRAKRFGLILGTLGRQGSPVVLMDLKRRMQERGLQAIVVLLSEIRPEKLARFKDHVDAWVQVACPRLSIDWGHQFDPEKPLLSPYEMSIVLGVAKPFWIAEDLEAAAYPMDYYAKDSAGPWTPNYTPRTDARKAL
jgi:2-(3-amino-3-carboxypropyl)histidine synthase